MPRFFHNSPPIHSDNAFVATWTRGQFATRLYRIYRGDPLPLDSHAVAQRDAFLPGREVTHDDLISSLADELRCTSGMNATRIGFDTIMKGGKG